MLQPSIFHLLLSINQSPWMLKFICGNVQSYHFSPFPLRSICLCCMSFSFLFQLSFKIFFPPFHLIFCLKCNITWCPEGNTVMRRSGWLSDVVAWSLLAFLFFSRMLLLCWKMLMAAIKFVFHLQKIPSLINPLVMVAPSIQSKQEAAAKLLYEANLLKPVVATTQAVLQRQAEVWTNLWRTKNLLGNYYIFTDWDINW